MIITFLDNASNTLSLIKLFRKLNHTVCFSPFEKGGEGRGNKVVQNTYCRLQKDRETASLSYSERTYWRPEIIRNKNKETNHWSPLVKY